MNVNDVMTRGVLSVQPATPIKEVARLMATYGVSGVPVIDDQGAILGVVSEADFLIKEDGVSRDASRLERILARAVGGSSRWEKVEATTARELMTSPAVTIDPEMPIREAASLMIDRGVNRLPVARAGQLVGIVSRADLMRAFLRADEELASEIKDELIRNTLWVEPGVVDVRVREGVVQLSGTLDRRSSVEWLVSRTRRVEGVVRVEASELRWEADDRDLRLPQEDLVARGYVR
jgi:CBS domain-containing protein